MQITNSTLNDIDAIFNLYNIASAYQKSKKTVVVWPEFEHSMVETEITKNCQWKLIINDEIACVWATTFSDEKIWQEKNNDAAVYIHRIATNPNFRGKNFVQLIVNWCKDYAKQNHKNFIRLDTIGNNKGLINHYKNAGFTFLGLFNLTNTSGLPEHYSQGPACLFQIDLKQSL